MSDRSEYLITFEDVTDGQANVLADELKRELTEGAAEVEARVIKDDPSTMDAGGTLALILSTQAAIAIAYGIANFLSRRGVKVTITEKKSTADGTEERKIVAEHVGGDAVERIVKAVKDSGE